MEIKYRPDSNLCPTSHEIEDKMDIQNHVHSNSDSDSDSTSNKNCSSSSSDYSVLVSHVEEASDVVFNPLSNTEIINAVKKFCIKL